MELDVDLKLTDDGKYLEIYNSSILTDSSTGVVYTPTARSFEILNLYDERKVTIDFEDLTQEQIDDWDGGDKKISFSSVDLGFTSEEITTLPDAVWFVKYLVTATPQAIKTFTLPRALVAGESLEIVLNGNTLTEAFATTSDAVLADMADALEGDAGVDTAEVVDGGSILYDTVIRIYGDTHLIMAVTSAKILGASSLEINVDVASNTTTAVEEEVENTMVGYFNLDCNIDVIAGELPTTDLEEENSYLINKGKLALMYKDGAIVKHNNSQYNKSQALLNYGNKVAQHVNPYE